MVSEHHTPAALPPAGGLAVKNDKKINTSLKAGHMFATHADPHAHFISGQQSSVSGKPPPSPDVLPAHVAAGSMTTISVQHPGGDQIGQSLAFWA